MFFVFGMGWMDEMMGWVLRGKMAPSSFLLVMSYFRGSTTLQCHSLSETYGFADNIVRITTVSLCPLSTDSKWRRDFRPFMSCMPYTVDLAMELSDAGRSIISVSLREVMDILVVQNNRNRPTYSTRDRTLRTSHRHRPTSDCHALA
jgi:hypothetical protein